MNQLPAANRTLVDWFHRYLRWYVPRHFHAVRVANLSRFKLPQPGTPTIVILNHAGWWDPLLCMLLTRRAFGSNVIGYAPIDADALRQYTLFGKLGMFPVDMNSAAGAVQFFSCAKQVFARDGVLWLTPQGRFRDARERPLRFRGGAGTLLHRVKSARVLPIAFEYTYWEERLPEALINCGTPIEVVAGREHTAAEWTQALEDAMEVTQDELAALSIARNATAFEEILRGKAGMASIYDVFRRLRARTGGPKFEPEHGRIRTQHE